jgi:hypothetical protein
MIGGALFSSTIANEPSPQCVHRQDVLIFSIWIAGYSPEDTLCWLWMRHTYTLLFRACPMFAYDLASDIHLQCLSVLQVCPECLAHLAAIRGL